MERFTVLSSHAVPLPIENIDTDQITPARFLRVTDKVGLGDALFADWQRDPEFVLHKPSSKSAKILVAGDNFGCGSSREHAPWALVGHGFRAVISSRFADIFQNNALKNGLLPVTVSPEVLRAVFAQIAADPDSIWTIDLPAQTLTLTRASVGSPFLPTTFPIDGFAKTCLVGGVDELGYLLAHDSAIAAFEAARSAP